MKPAAQTYRTRADSDSDRVVLFDLAAALDATAGALKRGGCGAWHIAGARGHIHSDGAAWALFVGCRSAMHWTWTKKNSSFLSRRTATTRVV